MSREDWASNTIPKLFKERGLWPYRRPKYPHSILDVACGLSVRSRFVGSAFTVRVGLDLHAPYLEAARRQCPVQLKNWVPVVGDARDIDTMFLEKSFDLVLLLDIVEHLEKDDALHVIRSAEKIAKHAVVIETPLGFIHQNLDILGFEQHHLQTHRCGWEVEELENLGYQAFTRPYTMSAIRRHTEKEVDLNIQLIDAIKVVKGNG